MKILVRTLLLIVMIGMSIPVVAQDGTAEESVSLIPYTADAYGFETINPEGWTAVGQGAFTRASSGSDPTVIVQQSSSSSADAVLGSMLPRLTLTEMPESVGTHSGVLEWTLYHVEVEAVNVTVDLALSEVSGTTYLVILQAAPDEYHALRESVFLPILDALTPLEATEEPELTYIAEDVTFENGDVTLAGTLTLPPTAGPHPVIVLVSGSGPQDRDETLGGSIAIKPFRLLADALTNAGVAVLRYDDRGVGESTGDFGSATISDFASDAEAAIHYLLTREEINSDQIGLLGHSEGGLVAAMIGARNDDLDFIISMAGPAVNGLDLLIVQNQRLMEVGGSTQEEIDAQIAFVQELAKNLDDPQAIEDLTYQRALEQIDALTEDQRASLGDVEAYARQVAQQTAQQYTLGWFKSFVTYDPAPDWEQITIPVLALYGGKDVQVDAEQNAPALESELAEAGNEDFEVVTLPNANHLFQGATTGSPTEYATLPAEFTPDFLPLILDWLADHVEVAG